MLVALMSKKMIHENDTEASRSPATLGAIFFILLISVLNRMFHNHEDKLDATR